MAKIDGGDYADLTGSPTITAGLYDSGENIIEISVTKDQFTGLGDAIYANDSTVIISAVIYDKNGNSTTGTPSANTITIDTEPPVFGEHTVEVIVANGGAVVPT